VVSPLRIAAALAALTLGAGACNAVLGIDERTYDPATAGDAGAGGGSLCDSYCAAAQSVCTGDTAIYGNAAVCLATCAKMVPGTMADTTGNTVGCRLHQLEAAQEEHKPAQYCPAAGPGGDGACGSDCDGYCELMLGICPQVFDNATECQAACKAVPRLPPYTANIALENSIECRLYHLTNASLDPGTHCPHAAGQTKCVAQDGGK
jgi:hypothetical protein